MQVYDNFNDKYYDLYYDYYNDFYYINQVQFPKALHLPNTFQRLNYWHVKTFQDHHGHENSEQDQAASLKKKYSTNDGAKKLT